MSEHDDPAHRLPESNFDLARTAGFNQPDFLHTVIRTAAEGIAVCAEIPQFPHIEFSVWNDRMTELTGYTMAEINCVGWYQTIFPDPSVRARAIARAERMRTGDDLRQEQWTITRKDGRERVLSISTSRVGSGPGRAVVAMISDVTDQVRAEQALRESETRLAMSQHLARLGSWEWNIVTGSLWWSDAMFRLYGQDPGSFRPTLDACLNQFHPDDSPRVREVIRRTLEEGAPFHYECRVVRPDGSVRWKLCEGVLERDPDGLPIRMWGTAQDVTEQRQAEQTRKLLEDQLREAQRLESIGVLTGGVAHEFNNLLTTILGHAELAEMELPARTPGRWHLQPIREAANRAADLCRKMLAYAGKGRVVVSPLDFNNIVREAIKRVGHEEKLATDLDSGSPLTIRGDAERLRHLVANVIENAIETGCDCVRVTTRRVSVDDGIASRLRQTPGLRPGPYVLFEVSDNGPGMDEETLSHAFEPFFTTKFPGRGLGLAVVLGVVRTHSGGVEIDSGLGHGTKIRVYLTLA